MAPRGAAAAKALAALAALLCHVAATWAFSDGSVESVCVTMAPLHETTAQTARTPYTVTVNSAVIADGTPVTVTLTGTTIFKGFMLQARDVNHTILSGFSVQDTGAQIRDCPTQGMAVTHTSSDDKTSLSVQWIPTSATPSNIIFRATMLTSRSVYWLDVTSTVLTRAGVTPAVFPPLSRGPDLSIGNLTQSITSSDCGASKSCMRLPAGCDPVRDGAACFFVALTPLPAQRQVLVELSGPNEGFLALGFSNDTRMGEDDVYECIDVDGTVSVANTETRGRDFPTSYPTDILLRSVGNASTRLADGMLQCVFVLTASPVLPGKVDGTQRYFLFLAHGLSDEGEIEKHDVQPMVSRWAMSPLGSPAEVAATRSNSLVKAHGSLMLVAWLTLCSVGVVAARFFKPVWPGAEVGGQKIWFQIHRGLMALAVVATVTAFVIPFCYRLGWSGRAHSVLGCIVMALALAQPVMALFRPHPNTPRRPLFNWAHWGTGTTARILAAACLFLGVDMVSLDLPDRWDKLTLMGALLWQLLAEALLEMLGCCAPDTGLRDNFELDSVVNGLKAGKLQHNHSEKLHSLKVLVLIVYVCGNLAFLIALLVGVGLA